MNYTTLGNKQYSKDQKKVNIYGENIKTKSSAIKSFCYHPLSSILEITFNSGKNYVYFNVSAQTYTEFALSESKGKALNELIKKGQFKFLRMEE